MTTMITSGRPHGGKKGNGLSLPNFPFTVVAKKIFWKSVGPFTDPHFVLSPVEGNTDSESV